MLRGLCQFGLLGVLLLASPALAQGPGYEVVRQDPAGLELRFHGYPLRGVHADDSQNALSIDFQNPVDGAAFERLAGTAPQWISMAYASFDNGIIRSPRPVTFLTRTEPDGFSLRIIPRDGAPAGPPPPQYAQQQPYPPPQYAQQPYPPGPYPPPPGAYPPPGQYPQGYQPYVPPQQAYIGFHTYGEYQALRSYEAQILAIRRNDPMWRFGYDRAAMQSDSGVGIASNWDWYHGGDRMGATTLNAKLTIAPGLALVGTGVYTNVKGANVRLPAGTIAAGLSDDIFTGSAGVSAELGRDSELRLEANMGNDVWGGKMTLYSGGPSAFAFIKLDYHDAYLATPTAVAYRADTDSATIGYAQALGWNVWGSVAGHYTRYGVHGDADVARTAGWDADLTWNVDIYDGLLAGLSYDGHGEYRIGYDTRAGSAPTPFVPLGIRPMENHAVTATLSSTVLDQVWFSAYAGYVVDRYASDGLLAGMDLHYTPAPGVDLALGIRQSAVSYTQGERARQTTAGLNMTLGFGAPPQPSWMSNQL